MAECRAPRSATSSTLRSGQLLLASAAANCVLTPLATGFHFEALVVRDLRILAQPHDGTVESWRDKNGDEVEAIVTINHNKWAAFEIKLDPRPLLRERGQRQAWQPTVLGVITSTGVGDRREDGVHVIPIGCLGPRFVATAQPLHWI